MFFLALVFMTMSAGVIHRIGQGHTTLFEAEIIIWSVYILWPIFVAEATLRLFVQVGRPGPFWRNLSYCLLLSVAPPFRLAARAYADPDKVWLPLAGWRHVDRHLRYRLERFFSVPMIVIALLVLPLLAMEHLWLDTVRAHVVLSLSLDIGSSVIWMAFALEFIVMVSVSARRVGYCLAHWMDLAVVALPVIDFLPILRVFRLTRVLQLQQVSRLGRAYRLRGLLLKGWRAILVLEMIQRLFGNYKKKRLHRLRELLIARQEEILDLKHEIAELEQQLEKEGTERR